jgi:hypothetical protein
MTELQSEIDIQDSKTVVLLIKHLNIEGSEKQRLVCLVNLYLWCHVPKRSSLASHVIRI